MKRLTRQLLDKSQEAMIMALEIYNKPTVKYRIEGFCFFFTNAWELLLKAKILEDTKKESAIYYKKVRNQKKRSLSLRDALKNVIPKEDDPVRRNIEEIARIRDEATHLIIRELESVYTGLFQAGVFNYVRKLEEWFDVSLSDKISPAMLTLVFDVRQIDPAVIQKAYGKEILKFLETEEERLNAAEKELGDTRFRIPIEYHLVLTKKPKEADIVLSSGRNGEISGLILEVPKDIEKTHPYLQKDVMAKVKEQFDDSIIFNQYDFQAILYKYKIKGNRKYHYELIKPKIHKYSQDLVDFIVEKIKKDPDVLRRARESYRIWLKKRRRVYD